MVCEILENVNAIADEEIWPYIESAALVAVTMHVPAVVATNRPATTAQPAAVPLVTEYDTAPLPEPPVVANGNDEPMGPDCGVTRRALCGINSMAGAARTTPVASLAAAASGLTPLDSVMLKVI